LTALFNEAMQVAGEGEFADHAIVDTLVPSSSQAQGANDSLALDQQNEGRSEADKRAFRHECWTLDRANMAGSRPCLDEGLPAAESAKVAKRSHPSHLLHAPFIVHTSYSHRNLQAHHIRV
jgi:hypothetical protein